MDNNILGIGNMGTGSGFGSGSWFKPGRHIWTRRSDKSIEDNVNMQINSRPELSSASVQVQVIDGMVILTGQVLSQKIKNFIEDEIQFIPGVQKVKNELQASDPSL